MMLIQSALLSYVCLRKLRPSAATLLWVVVACAQAQLYWSTVPGLLLLLHLPGVTQR